MARILVTGANGQLAPAIIARLKSAGHSPVLLVRRPIEAAPHTTLCVLPAPWSFEALRDVMVREAVTGVVNLAAAGVRPDSSAIGSLYETNVALPVTLMMAGAGHVQSFVNIGSGAEYAGCSTGPIDENGELGTSHAYGMSKAASGLAALQVAGETRCAFAHLRLFGAYGEHEATHRLLPNLIMRLSRSEAVPLSDGLQTRDWLYEADIASAVVDALDSLGNGALPSGLYNLGSGNGATVRTFAETVADQMSVSRALLGFGRIPRRGKEVDTLVANAALFRRYTRWQPAYDLATGLERAVRRYLAKVPM